MGAPAPQARSGKILKLFLGHITLDLSAFFNYFEA